MARIAVFVYDKYFSRIYIKTFHMVKEEHVKKHISDLSRADISLNEKVRMTAHGHNL